MSSTTNKNGEHPIEEEEEELKCDCGVKLLICDSGMRLCSVGCKDRWVNSKGEPIEEYTEQWTMQVGEFKEYFLDDYDYDADDFDADDEEFIVVHIGWMESYEDCLFSLRWKEEDYEGYCGTKENINSSSCFAIMMSGWMPEDDDDEDDDEDPIRIDASNKIKEWWKKIYWSPKTKVGIKRFNRECQKLGY